MRAWFVTRRSRSKTGAEAAIAAPRRTFAGAGACLGMAGREGAGATRAGGSTGTADTDLLGPGAPRLNAGEAVGVPEHPPEH